MLNIILLNFNLLIFFIYCYKKIRQGLHILQLENYYNDRYLKWLKENSRNVFRINDIILLLILIGISFISLRTALILNILIYMVLSVFFRRKKEKKPFVVTSRIRRMYLTFLIIFGSVAYLINSIDFPYAILTMNILVSIVHIFVYIVNLINRPIEKAIRLRFILRAKKKLKENSELKVVGVTGSYGKTSTKYIVETILSQKYHTLMTPESYNTTMGVVRTINEKLKPTHNLFICEMGAKYVGDVKEICKIVKPKYRNFDSNRTTTFRYF